MKLASVVGNNIFLLFEIPFAEFQELKYKDILGVPRYFATDSQGGLFVWPLPMDDCKVYRLDDQGYVV